METVFWLVACVPFFPVVFMISFGLAQSVFPGKVRIFTMLIFGAAWLSAFVAFLMVVFNGGENYTSLAINLDSLSTPVFGFLVDRLSLLMVLLVLTVSGVVHLYSLRAMQEEKHFRRYFRLLSLVTIAVLLVILSNNLLMLYLFWMVKGFSLTFLLAHYQNRQASWQAAMKKLRLDLIGYSAFLFAVILTWNIFGTFDFQTINQMAANPNRNLPSFQLTLLTILIFVAIMPKSAQFPLHSWLPNSVEAPTPVSALMHAGLINAGGFLFVRLSSLFVATPFTMGLAIVVGSFTMLYGTALMLTRNDVKSMLVYSTMGQMGFMILECGMGAFALAILHIIAHGLFKAALFLNSGNVIREKTTMQFIAPAQHDIKASATRFVISSAFVALLLVAGQIVFDMAFTNGSLLLIFAWITINSAALKISRLPLVVLLAALTIFVCLYLLGLHLVEIFFSPVIAAPALVDARLVAIGGGLLFLLGMASLLLQTVSRPNWVNNIFKKVYVRLLFMEQGR